jgi:hypothetical protein
MAIILSGLEAALSLCQLARWLNSAAPATTHAAAAILSLVQLGGDGPARFWVIELPWLVRGAG